MKKDNKCTRKRNQKLPDGKQILTDFCGAWFHDNRQLIMCKCGRLDQAPRSSFGQIHRHSNKSNVRQHATVTLQTHRQCTATPTSPTLFVTTQKTKLNFFPRSRILLLAWHHGSKIFLHMRDILLLFQISKYFTAWKISLGSFARSSWKTRSSNFNFRTVFVVG